MNNYKLNIKITKDVFNHYFYNITFLDDERILQGSTSLIIFTKNKISMYSKKDLLNFDKIITSLISYKFSLLNFKYHFDNNYSLIFNFAYEKIIRNRLQIKTDLSLITDYYNYKTMKEFLDNEYTN